MNPTLADFSGLTTLLQRVATRFCVSLFCAALLFVPDSNAAPPGHRLALVIGTSNYTDPVWPHLPNAVSDAQALGDELARRYGYRVERLIDPTLDTLKHKLREIVGSVGANDDLFVFVAGHGHLDPLDRAGYLVMSDATPGCASGCYPFDNLKRAFYDVRARHVLITLDTCFAGAVDVAASFGGDSMRSSPMTDLAPNEVARLLREYDSVPSRLIFASTVDRPTSDGQPGRHSPFATALLRELGAPGTAGVVTLDRLYLVTQRGSEPLTAMRPVAFLSQRPHHPNGTFVFVEDTDLCKAVERLVVAASSGFAELAMRSPVPAATGVVSATRSGLPGASDCRLWRLSTGVQPLVRCDFGEASPELALARHDSLAAELDACLPDSWTRRDVDLPDLQTRARVFTNARGRRVSATAVCEGRCSVNVTIEP